MKKFALVASVFALTGCFGKTTVHMDYNINECAKVSYASIADKAKKYPEIRGLENHLRYATWEQCKKTIENTVVNYDKYEIIREKGKYLSPWKPKEKLSADEKLFMLNAKDLASAVGEKVALLDKTETKVMVEKIYEVR